MCFQFDTDADRNNKQFLRRPKFSLINELEQLDSKSFGRSTMIISKHIIKFKSRKNEKETNNILKMTDEFKAILKALMISDPKESDISSAKLLAKMIYLFFYLMIWNWKKILK